MPRLGAEHVYDYPGMRSEEDRNERVYKRITMSGSDRLFYPSTNEYP